jgi:hypothetical protein
MPSKHEALNSNPSSEKKKRKEMYVKMGFCFIKITVRDFLMLLVEKFSKSKATCTLQMGCWDLKFYWGLLKHN